MPSLTATVTRPFRPAKPSRVTVRATRPSIIDLRFREDAWVVEDGDRARVCLGNYSLGGLSVTSFDVPALNTLFGAVSLGQARRQMTERRKRG